MSPQLIYRALRKLHRFILKFTVKQNQLLHWWEESDTRCLKCAPQAVCTSLHTLKLLPLPFSHYISDTSLVFLMSSSENSPVFKHRWCKKMPFLCGNYFVFLRLLLLLIILVRLLQQQLLLLLCEARRWLIDPSNPAHRPYKLCLKLNLFNS